MRFLTLEDCSDSELHCVYHDPERTVTVLHPRTACSLQVYAPEEDAQVPISTFHTRRPNATHSWWLQLLGITENSLLGVADSAVEKSAASTQEPEPPRHEIDRDSIRWHLVNVRSIIPAHDVLDEEDHIQSVIPLPSPWSWPSNTFYREARRGYTDYLTESLIQELVTHGLMVANHAGIRWKHLDQYVLVKTDEDGLPRAHRPRFEKLDTRAFRRERIERPDADGALGGDRPGTPIVELESLFSSTGEKRVRLCSKKECVCGDGQETTVMEEDVLDNEGKTATASKAREAERRKVRSKICWDSDRAF